MRDQLAEPGHEGIKLFLHPLRDSVLHNAVDIFLLVFFGDRNIFTSRFQLNGYHLAETLFGGGKCLIDDIRDVVLTSGRRREVSQFRFL